MLVKLLEHGDLAVGFFNLCSEKERATMLFEMAGFPASSGYTLEFKDVFTGKKEINRRETLTLILEPYSCRVFRATPVKI